MNPAEKKRFSNRRILYRLSIVLLAYSSMSQSFLASLSVTQVKDKQNEFTLLNRQETNQSENADVHLSTLNGTTVKDKTNQTENGFWNISAEYSGIVGIEEEGCQRRCHPDWAHRNIIIFKFRQGDGISDRLYVIENLAFLAGHLCAILYFPPPYKMLNTRHNGWQPVSKNLTWSDLQNFRFLDDGSRVVKGYDIKPALLSEYPTDPNYDDWLRVVLPKSRDKPLLREQFLSQAKRLENFTSLQRTGPGFIWEMKADFWLFEKAFLEFKQKEGTGCKIVQAYPDTAYQLKEKLFDEWKERYPYTTHFVYLYIRRGDTKHVCDTSLKRMQAYISCSFNQTKTYGNITVLFSSDERDVSYRNKIRSMVVEGEDNERLARTFIDVDAATSKVLRDYAKDVVGGERLLNNYVLFTINKSVMSDERLSMKLAKHRSNCPKCSSIHQELTRVQKELTTSAKKVL